MHDTGRNFFPPAIFAFIYLCYIEEFLPKNGKEFFKRVDFEAKKYKFCARL